MYSNCDTNIIPILVTCFTVDNVNSAVHVKLGHPIIPTMPYQSHAVEKAATILQKQASTVLL